MTKQTESHRIAELERLVEQLKVQNQGLVNQSFKRIRVSPKGAVSIYGLGKFPVTLYKSQWDQLLSMVPDIQKFIKENIDQLAVKAA